MEIVIYMPTHTTNRRGLTAMKSDQIYTSTRVPREKTRQVEQQEAKESTTMKSDQVYTSTRVPQKKTKQVERKEETKELFPDSEPIEVAWLSPVVE
jgi:predicted molibdopterin-dependent oxidoreductase YjgC